MAASFRHGLTLLEVLAVVVVLGLLGTALSSTALLGGGRSLAEVRAASATLRAGEARARMSAIGGGGTFRLTGSEMLSERVWPLGTTATTFSELLPTDIQIQLFVEGRPTDRLQFDARGRSTDAEAMLTQGATVVRLHLAGLTGVWSDMMQ